MPNRPLDESDPNLGFSRGLVREKPAAAYVVKVRRYAAAERLM
ncbi:MAG: hypothetical protein U9R25_08455 [Chloroflexota bacterium]|nr:hypothetical protein [Chloroflexota bacterium]